MNENWQLNINFIIIQQSVFIPKKGGQHENNAS
jgi:hypothetical protein